MASETSGTRGTAGGPSTGQDRKDEVTVGRPARLADPLRSGGTARTPGFGIGFLALVVLSCTAVVIAATVSAVLFSSLQDEVYGARVDLIYRSSPDTSDDARERILTTQRAVIRSRAVLGPVAEENGVSLGDLERALNVDVGLDDLIHVTVGDPDRAKALALAGAVAERYVQTAGELSQQTQRGRALLRDQIALLSDRLRRASGQDAAALRERIGRLQDRRLDLEIESFGQSKPEVLTAGYPLDAPLSPKPLRAAAVGVMVGLVLAIGLAVVLVRRRLTSADEP